MSASSIYFRGLSFLAVSMEFLRQFMNLVPYFSLFCTKTSLTIKPVFAWKQLSGQRLMFAFVGNWRNQTHRQATSVAGKSETPTIALSADTRA